MNVCIIGAQRDENARYLYEEFKKKEFSKVLLVDLAKLYVEMSKVAKVYYRTELDWDVYITRPRVEDFPFTFLVASILEENALVSPSSESILRCHDRGLLAATILKSGLNQPLTYTAASAEIAKGLAQKSKKIALKFIKHGGKGVAILKGLSTSELLDVLSGLRQPFCIQKFIKGEIIKALVIGEEVIGIK